MAEELRMALVDVLRKAGVEQANFLREAVRVLAQELMELSPLRTSAPSLVDSSETTARGP